MFKQNNGQENTYLISTFIIEFILVTKG